MDMVPTIGCYQLHYLRDSVGKVIVKPSGVSNQPAENDSAQSRHIFKRATDGKPAGHDEVAELKGMLHITPDEGWLIT